MTSPPSSPDRDSVVSLREITAETVRAICRLVVKPEQAGLVTPNALSIAEAHFSPHAWFRAIHADDEPVGFVMLELAPGQPVFLWRFMIDARHQALGFGRRALALVIDHARTALGATTIETTVVLADGGPRPFYERAGFVLTGAFEDGEAVMRLAP
jgi:diamine N-acetyltransferase